MNVYLDCLPCFLRQSLEAAHAAGLHEVVQVIDNGSDAPGTILDDCSAEFRERLRTADMIIAKGQGNFETLSDIDANLTFLFKVKCPIMARHAGLPLGQHVLRSALHRPEWPPWA